MSESVDETIGQLEEQASFIVQSTNELVGSGRLNKPFFIEFSGTPKAGKTTIINSLRLFLTRNGFTVSVLVERASTAPIADKLHFHFNVWTACQTLTQTLEASQWPDRNQVVIVDRGLFDALAWMDWMVQRGSMTDEDMTKVVSFLTMRSWVDLFDLVFVMKTTPEESLNREHKDQVTKKRGRIMNEDAIKSFNESLDRTMERHGELFRSIHTLETVGNVTPTETGRDVVTITLDVMGETLATIRR